MSEELFATFHSQCPACARIVQVYYKDGKRWWWDHVGPAGTCEKANKLWEQNDLTGFNNVNHQLDIQKKGWVP